MSMLKKYIIYFKKLTANIFFDNFYQLPFVLRAHVMLLKNKIAGHKLQIEVRGPSQK